MIINDNITNEYNNHPVLVGTIAGDPIGSTYEFNNTKRTEFELLQLGMNYISNSLMTLVVADWLLNRDPQYDDVEILTNTMLQWAKKYPCPTGGYGGRFLSILMSSPPMPYDIWDNASALRVSGVGYAADTLDDALRRPQSPALLARRIIECTYNPNRSLDRLLYPFSLFKVCL